jgi:hypothetical protein
MTMSIPEQVPAPQPRGNCKSDSLNCIDIYDGPEGNCGSHSRNCIDIYDDSEGDCTVRPVRSPDLLRVRPLQPPSAEVPPEKEDKRPGESGPDREAAGS